LANKEMIDLTEKFSVKKLQFLEATISKVEDKMYHIIIPISKFIFENNITETAINLSQVALPNDFSKCIGKTVVFPINPNQGYTDGSIYLAERHNPVDVSEIKFINFEKNILNVEMSMFFDFEFEGTGLKNETIIKKIKIVSKNIESR
jgi:hypothetical protein